MFETQEILFVKKEELLEKVKSIFDDDYRLVQIGCTQLDSFQIDYTFDKNLKFLNIRVNIPLEDPQLPSITGIYLCAFTYENELHDLFGIKIDSIGLDYKGNFYRVGVRSPFRMPLVAESEEDSMSNKEKVRCGPVSQPKETFFQKEEKGTGPTEPRQQLGEKSNRTRE